MYQAGLPCKKLNKLSVAEKVLSAIMSATFCFAYDPHPAAERNRMLRFALAASVLLASFIVHAKTPGEVYEESAKSTVIVLNIDSGGKAKSMGSGVVLPDGDVVTNCHVAKGASQLKVRIGAKEYPATLRHSDWDRDVCSLTAPGIGAPAVVMGSTISLKIGDKVYAIGAPKGLDLTLSDGIVSSLREVEGGQYIQTTAAISPGSSGGGPSGAQRGTTTPALAGVLVCG